MTHTGMVSIFHFKDTTLAFILPFHGQDKSHDFSISFLDKGITAESHIWINKREDSAGDGGDKWRYWTEAERYLSVPHRSPMAQIRLFVFI